MRGTSLFLEFSLCLDSDRKLATCRVKPRRKVSVSQSTEEAVDSPPVPPKRKGGSPTDTERSAKKIRGGSSAPEDADVEPGEVNSPEKTGQAAAGEAAEEGERAAAAEAAAKEKRVATDVATRTEGAGVSTSAPVAADVRAAGLGALALTQSPAVEDLTQLTPTAEARSPFAVTRSLGAFGLPATSFDESLRQLSAIHQVISFSLLSEWQHVHTQ